MAWSGQSQLYMYATRESVCRNVLPRNRFARDGAKWHIATMGPRSSAGCAVLALLFSSACSLAVPTNVTEIIRSWGYPCEDHSVQTSDGYILSLQRVPYGKAETSPGSKGVVFLQHGLSSSAVSWSLNLPEESLVYILADSGYDVWLGNNRGNGYSMKNIHFSPDSAQFWNFTWDEMASIDLPTMIAYVVQQTGAKKVGYVGCSEGTTQAFAGFEDAALADKVSVFVGLAPVAYVYHQRSLLLSVLALLRSGDILKLLGDHEFYLQKDVQKLLPGFCKDHPGFCLFDSSLLFGPSVSINTSRLPFYLNYYPAPTSVKNLIHWSQGVRVNKFQKYDYGSSEANEAAYGQPTPPQYSLAAIPSSLPIALFTGGEDYLADPRDVQHMISQLAAPPVVHHNQPKYDHMDPILATNAHVVDYPIILSLFEKYVH